MRKLLLFTLALFVLGTTYGQDSLAARYKRQHLRLYLQGGMLFSNINMMDPERGKASYFKTSGVTSPAIEAGVIMEAKGDKPGFYLGAGVRFFQAKYDGERYVKIISPTMEELEDYDVQQRMSNIELFAGYYLWLGDKFALKPQLGLGLLSSKNKLVRDTYEYQTDNLKRSRTYNVSETKLATQVALFLSFRKNLEAGLTYMSTSSMRFSGDYATPYAPVGAVVRYIFSL